MVPADGPHSAEVVRRQQLPIIRRINPGAADGTDIPADIEPAWRLAVQSIIDEHNGRANPPPETSRLPPSQRFALELLADPAVALPDGAEDAYELLSAPRDGAVKLALSAVQRRLAARDIDRIDAAREIVAIRDGATYPMLATAASMARQNAWKRYRPTRNPD